MQFNNCDISEFPKEEKNQMEKPILATDKPISKKNVSLL